MAFACVYSAQPSLLCGEIISVEIDTAQGLHSFSIVGLPDKAVEESRDRVSAALKNASFSRDNAFRAPKHSNQKVTVSLAPAHSKKEGAYFDVPIALAYLVAEGELPAIPQDAVFVGELSLNGEIRGVRGVLILAQEAKRRGYTTIFVPEANGQEAALIDGITVYAPGTLDALISHLRGDTILAPVARAEIDIEPSVAHGRLEDIHGLEHAKRGLLIAAAGGHNIAFYGPPGTGKTLLARALASLLPPLTREESLEVTGIHSVAGVLHSTCITQPPVRTPHHTSSYASLVGGGTIPRPGEVTLAHRGVLFLDEFPEFDRRVINALRQPLEDGVVSISRSRASAQFPSRFILVAAMNPCPCGHYGTERCTCTPARVVQYQQKISGPIVDRIDMWIEVGAVAHEHLLTPQTQKGETKDAQRLVIKTREIQRKRFKHPSRLNSGMSVAGLMHHAKLSDSCTAILNSAAKRLALSPRSYHRVVRLARTIADLDESDTIEDTHVLEALSYRPKNDTV